MRGGPDSEMSSPCIQTGVPRSLGGYQPSTIMEPHSPSPAWHAQYQSKQDRNDSGINSGSDFHSSSPGSDTSLDYNPAFAAATTTSASQSRTPVCTQTSQTYNPATAFSTSSSTSAAPTSSYCNSPAATHYSTPIFPKSNNHAAESFNPPTPPRSESMPSPQSNITIKCESESSTTLTPINSPQVNEPDNEDPLKSLQMAFEKNDYLPSALSPKTTSEHSNDDENKSDVADEFDDDGIKAPKLNSHGKMKSFKCKQCDFVAYTKLEFWEHSKIHISADKLLMCTKCPFVTEYKHHLEYHLRNHAGSKPFKCDQCNYSCVNKSMLNSHMKSHSSIYQYRCKDCSYATKYCHSLKLHLRKYTHKPATVLNLDGTPNPLPIIDVYGTRRGPKQKPQSKEVEKVAPNPFAQFMMNTQQLQLPIPYPFLGGFSNPLANPMFFPQLNQLMNQQENDKQEESNAALDLSKPEPTCSDTPVRSRHRRKGKAYKVKVNVESEQETTEESKADVLEPEVTITELKTQEPSNTALNFRCQYCNITFGDAVLHSIHMGYHGYKDPFTCNMCGEKCTEKVAFFLHIAKNPHIC